MGHIVESKTYDSIARKRVLDTLCRVYPFWQKRVIGRSCGGRDICSYRIGTGEETVLFAAAFHGSEHISAVVLMMLMEEISHAVDEKEMIAGYPIVKRIANKSLLFVPCVNPDGCDVAICGGAACGSREKEIAKLCKSDFAHWNANLRGVDINHNFDAGWHDLRKREREAGIFGPRSTRYGGPYPESEPETKALAELCRLNNMRRVVALHAQGEVIYYRYGEHTPERSKEEAILMAKASGYTLEEPEGLAVGGGYKDWFIETFHRPGFTIELGKGQNPLPPESARSIYEKAREMLTLCAIL